MMRLNLLDYDLSAVSGRGTTTVSQINEGLSRVAESLAIVWISAHKDAAKLDVVQSRIEQYIALDHYSKFVPNSTTKERSVFLDAAYYWHDATNGTLLRSVDTVCFPWPTAYKGFMILDCCNSGRFAAEKRKVSTSAIAYTSNDIDILWRMQEDSAPSAVLGRNLLAEIQAQGSSAPSVENLSRIIAIVDEMIAHSYLDGLARAFEQINQSGSHPAHLIALLRTTGIYRSKILGWESFRDKVRSRLEDLNVNIAKVMRGLI